jgi:nucleoid-associated protein YgaU
MTSHLMAKSKMALAAITALSGAFIASPSLAQTYPITPAQKATASEVALKGIALSELADNAPDRYTVKSGDTLWGISSLFLKSPWRWPELWGMNLEEIKNPHRIYPGQVLVLERSNGRATLKVGGAAADPTDGIPTVRVSPQTRYEALSDNALTTLRSSFIEAFLAEPMILTDAEFQGAPRIVSAQEGRVLLTRGDRAYARGGVNGPLLDDQAKLKQFRVFRTATPLKDPGTGEVLGFEAIYAGKATLVRGETTSEVTESDGKSGSAIVPATIDIISAKEEIRVGDRLMPEPPRQLQTYTPHAPAGKVDGRIVSVYGSAVVNAAQNQVVVINRGKLDGMDPGTVLSILKDGARVVDKQDAAKPLLKLPNERNGLLMVFRTFDRLSYALILEINDAARVGDRLTAPR